MLLRKTAGHSIILVLCFVFYLNEGKHHKTIGSKIKHKTLVKRQATSSYDDWLKSAPDQYSAYGSSEDPQPTPGTPPYAQDVSQYTSDQATESVDTSSSTSPSQSQVEDYSSQPAWCQDNKMCSNFHQSDCKSDDWVQLNCPRKCDLCFKSTDTTTSLNDNQSTEAPEQSLANQTTSPATPADQSNSNATYSEYLSSSPTTASPEDNKLQYNYTMKVEDLPESNTTTRPKVAEKVYEEDINITVPVTGETTAEEGPSGKKGDEKWCKDAKKCSKMKKSECNGDWMQLNCPKRCGVCGAGKTTDSDTESNVDKTKHKKKFKGFVEDIRVTLPSDSVSPEKCEDHAECIEYPVSSCHKQWMKINCRSKCALCGKHKKKLHEDKTQEYTLENHNDNSGVCYYDGIPHDDGSKWSPGPCTPECDCENGNVRCTVIHCPKLTCDRQVKKRWSCCPKCLDQDDNCTKAVDSNTTQPSCCVLPFIFKGVQYETCTSEENDQPWCSLTENFDLDGKWGICDEGKPTSKSVHHPRVSPKSYQNNATSEHKAAKETKPEHSSNIDIYHVEKDDKPKTSVHEDKKYHESAPKKNPEKTHKHGVHEGDYKMEDSEEDDDEEVLRKYGSKYSEKEEEVDVEPEPLDGGYTEWSMWTKCLTSCGGGVQERSRKCSRPPPAFGGSDCRHLGAGLETRQCNTSPCPIKGGFSGWSPWVECSASCGGGVTSRSRLCDNPEPKYGGKDCVLAGLGQMVQTKACNNVPCIDKSAFSPWSDWTQCTKKCGGGVSVRKRTCTSTSTNGHGCSLLGSETQSKSCNTRDCSVDGGYTPWTAWSACSRSCGPGITSRHRTCTDPMPSEDGKDCSALGEAFQQNACYVKECKASGNWTAWSKWEKCNVPCGGGAQSRYRKCIGKQSCQGNSKETQLCNAYHCPIDGKYGAWSEWSKCSKACGDGKSKRTRRCNSPAPQFGGKHCEELALGPSEVTQKCNLKDCQVSHDGGYGPWSGWTQCSMSCGAGMMSRYRACDNPEPAGTGKDCSKLGLSSQSVPCYNRECPIHGNYTEWSDWSACSASCGDGSRYHTRSCTNPRPQNGGDSCQYLGDDIESEPCYEAPCPVSAKYGDWSHWSGCSKSCGYGIRHRTRRCLGASQYGEKYCDDTGLGLGKQAERCFERSCPVDGNYGSWSPWSQCSTSCGGGAMSRFRNCSDPVPMYGGRGCERIGSAFEIKSCSENFCPVDGGYSEWSNFSPCTQSCGTGETSRTRSCTNPTPEHGGKDCSSLGEPTEVNKCATDPCPVPGNYSDWSRWSNCSSQCGNGIMVRSRACNNPAPSTGGQDCVSLGPRTEQQNCLVKTCPEHCSCGGWTAWSECDKSCGGGLQTRKRQCTPPKSGLESCKSEEEETQLCNLDICPIDGGYNDWSSWSQCTGGCGHGKMTRSRLCNTPEPAYGGRYCEELGVGPGYEAASCYNNPCPVHGKYSTWSPWNACSTTCGMGEKRRTRSCDNPPPSSGGLDCSRYGQNEQSVDCFVADCPVDGAYSSWTEWSECSQSCGWGYQSRERECDSPEPAHGGRDCTMQGGSNEVQPCMMVECPVDGAYNEWSAWGECSKTCGVGKKRRKRSCSSPKPHYGGSSCIEQKLGDTAETAKCNLGPCPDAGGWGDWSAWSYCSASCGRGKMERSRECDSPEPLSGGKPCVGLVTQQKDCKMADCPVNGNYTNWGPWTQCDATCGDGFQTRWRSCSNPVTTGQGRDCSSFAPDYESKACQKSPCKVHGSWASWSDWSGCSKTCGDGAQVRTRTCSDPSPAAGGKPCVGVSNQEKYCKQRECCDIPFVDLGCFVDTGNPSTLPETLLTDTDNSSPYFSGVAVKRAEKGWDDYMSNLICRCAQITNQKGYSHFGIQNLGECRSGPSSQKSFASQGARVAFTKSGPRPWVGCLGKGMKQCQRPSLNCVGQDQTNYVFGLKNIAPVNGNYTAWSTWSACSKSCGRGITSRRRDCTNPPALFDGKDCSEFGPDEEIQDCIQMDCPVNGVWSGWAAWTQCSASCGKGRRTRVRSCNSPKASSGGDPCTGPDTEIAECFVRNCPVDGRWSDWQAWEPCSVSCGYGVQVRTRYCNEPPPINGGKLCEGDLMESTPCEAKQCPIHGNYADWSNWSGCSRSCGRGSKTRVRKCINPVPRFNGDSCDKLGPAEEKTHCNVNPCPAHGNWGMWTSWSKCTAECGPGVRSRDRRCDNPYPTYGGKQCFGAGHETTPCSMQDCPIDGDWSTWSDWSQCQSDCGIATRERSRSCSNPPPSHGGKGCEGDAEEYHDCKLDQCPLDGAYSDWSDWGPCDQSCGSGHKLRVRSCSNPVPQFGGKNCSAQGPEHELASCNTDPCPVNGGWSGWTSWAACSQDCGIGSTTRTRSCSYPVPEFGGRQCDGKSEEQKTCKNFDCCDIPYKDIGCYIDTQRIPRPLPELLFSDRDKISWKNWKGFMADLICKCARETRNKQYTHFGIQHYGECYSGPESWRTFEDEGLRQDFTRPPDPQPWVGCVDDTLNECKEPNLQCVGKQNSNFVYTVDRVVPVDGNYSDWSDWSECSTTCGAGSRYRIRSCSNPAPSFSGRPCDNSDEDIESCFLNDCPIDGGWGVWGDWSHCSVSCGTGTMTRTRSCDNPKPGHGGVTCKGPESETVQCDLHKCPVDGRWSDWSSWSQCSSSCGNGLQSRKRQCNTPKAEYGGQPCVGSSVYYQNCVEKECPGVWGDWSDWSSCSRTCGSGGTHTRSRTCQGGPLCHGPRHDTAKCELQPCPECTKPADIAFLLDSSSALDQDNWNEMKSFVRGIANAFTLNDEATRVALITYATKPRLELAFDEKNDRDEFSDFLNTVTAERGSSDLQSALAMANNKLFTPEGGMRTKVPNVALFLTSDGPKFDNFDDNAATLKEKGVTVIGVGVGNTINQYELQRLTSGPDHAYMADSLDDVIASIASIANTTCLAKPTPPQVKWGAWSDWSSCSRLCDSGTRHRSRTCINGDGCHGDGKEEDVCMLQKCPECKSTMDVVFAIPIADSIPKSQLNDAKKFVRGIIDGMQVSPQGTHVGLLGYFDYPRVELKLDTFYEKEDILRALSSMALVDGFNNTRIDSALTAVQNDMFAQGNGVRAHVPKVLVVLASGDATDQNLKAASMPLKTAGTTIIPLVTGDLDTKAVSPMGTSARHYFASDTFGNLASKLDSISKQMCTAPTITPQRSKSTQLPKFTNYHSIHGMNGLFLKTAKNPDHKKPTTHHHDSAHATDAVTKQPKAASHPKAPSPKPDAHHKKVADTGHMVVSKPPARVVGTKHKPHHVLKEAKHRVRKPVISSQKPTSDVSRKNEKSDTEKPSVVKEKKVQHKDLWRDWSSWSRCSQSCGAGKRSRYKKCYTDDCTGQTPYQERVCNLQPCYDCNHNLDLALAIDSSDTVAQHGWQQVKNFLNSIVDSLSISKPGTHVGVLTFSSVPYLEARLSENHDRKNLKALVNNMQPLLGKQRRADKALYLASEEFFSPKSSGFRDGVSKALLFITGGSPTKGSESVQMAIKPLIQHGVTPVIVAVGDDIEEKHFKFDGSERRNFIKVAKYDNLMSHVQTVVADLCQAAHRKPPPLPPPNPVSSNVVAIPTNSQSNKLQLTTKKIESLINKWGTWTDWGACSHSCGDGQKSRSRECVGYNCTGPSIDKESCFLQDCPDCEKDIDLVFAVDASDDVVDRDFMQEKKFVQNVIHAFKVAKDKTRVGVATFGADVSEDVPLTNMFDKDSLNVAVNSLVKNSGRKDLEKVLEAARTKLFTGARQNVGKVLVLLTSDLDKLSPSNTASELSQSLKRSGYVVIAVGAGSSDVTARNMLGKLATSSSKVFPVSKFNELNNNVYLVATSACQAMPRSPTPVDNTSPAPGPPMCTKAMDVAFALDSSDDVSSFQWQQQKDFVRDVISGLGISSNGVHTGIVAYGAMPSVGLKLNQRYKDKQGLIQTLQGLDRAVGKRNMVNLLDVSRQQVFGATSGRRHTIPSTFVVFQYGATRADHTKLQKTAEDLKRSGVNVYVVGVGSKITRDHLATVASSPTNILHLPSLSDREKAKTIVTALCAAKKQDEKGPIAHVKTTTVKAMKDSPVKTKVHVNAKMISAPKKAKIHVQGKPKHIVEKIKKDDKDFVATSCASLKARSPDSKDGEYRLTLRPHCSPVKIYCYGMNTEDPSEYLTLEENEETNYASFHKERLKNFNNCDGPVDPSPDLTSLYWGKTRFNKLRLLPKKGAVKLDDFRFAISEGNPVRYGRAGDCFSLGECRRGGFNIDLSGTGMRLRRDVKWVSWGTPKQGSRMVNFTRSDDNTRVSALCGGSCGGCQPKSGRIYLVPSECDVPIGKNLKRSLRDHIVARRKRHAIVKRLTHHMKTKHHSNYNGYYQRHRNQDD